MIKIVIIDYGVGNIQSNIFALERLGYSATVSREIETILAADKLILPGVGSAQTAMTKLKEYQLDTLIPKLKQPLLGICLGMQLLCSHSEEGNISCLGIISQKVKQIPAHLKSPQVGWNTLYDLKSALFEGIKPQDYSYMVHRYYVELCPETIATTQYENLVYSSALQKDNFYGTQFHPEKSGSTGERILQNFINL